MKTNKRESKDTIFIEVAGGVADLATSVRPPIHVEFIDYDNLGIGKLASSFLTASDARRSWNELSSEARRFIRKYRAEEYRQIRELIEPPVESSADCVMARSFESEQP